MRYTELPWPFDGWTVDNNGIIHTASGYRTTPQKIEAFCWLLGMHEAVKIYGSDRLMFNESSIEEKRPIFDWRDTLLETRRPNDIATTGARPNKKQAGRAPTTAQPAARRSRRHEQ